ncbi:hypothetical protein [Massilia sp. CCM 8734]|uniref:hypothetical protein n=1 Tax=Massilia sp. CCM 8734 TaxID=2609283 RepID=UPI001422F64D|nr:hypothetical protein [Massilia sp. CCM 8734]NIA00410.1 hypothetical protein [Massilia sp. CCM 8734]
MSEEYIVCGWDSEIGNFTRPMTDDEIAQVLADRAAAAVPVVPVSVPMLNARLALNAAGHMAAVQAFVDEMPGVDGEQARTYLEYAQNVRRDHWLVEGIRQMLKLTPADIDTLFITAATID